MPPELPAGINPPGNVLRILAAFRVVCSSVARCHDPGQCPFDLRTKLVEPGDHPVVAWPQSFTPLAGGGSRWMEQILRVVLVLAVLTVESIGVLITVAISRNLNHAWRELTQTAAEIGRGNFDVSVAVRSRDELGQLAPQVR